MRGSFPPLLVRASAGTGKTYELSGRFIGILLQGERPDRILATTFTRKAAGEIRERIIHRLAQGARSEHHARTLGDQVGVDGVTLDRVVQTLAAVIDMQHRLRVCTLDSLFSQMARGFFGELGLSPEWRLLDDEEVYRTRIEHVHQMFAQGGVSEVVALLERLLRGHAESALSRALVQTVVSGYSLYRSAPPAAWGFAMSRALPTESEWRSALDRLQSAQVALTKKGEPNKPFLNARDKVLRAIEARDCAKIAESQLVVRARGEGTFSKVPIPEGLSTALQCVATLAAAVLEAEILDETLAVRDLLGQYQRARDRSSGVDAVSFDDLKFLLSSFASTGSLEEVFFRLDSRIHHLLLDEFQDTSSIDWAVVEPLADEILSKSGEEYSFFCVGDVKQAIYGWRGGVAEIFDTLENRWSQLVAETRERSYRCSPAVLELVNRIFEQVPSCTTLEEFPKTQMLWKARFNSHSAHRSTPYGRATVVACEGASAWWEQVATEVVSVRNRVGAAVSIGILLSRNDSVREVAEAVRRLGLDVSEEGGNPVNTVQPVSQILSALRLLDHPGDSVASRHVAESPLARRVGISLRSTPLEIGNAVCALRTTLLDGGYAAFVGECSRAYEGLATPTEERRLGHLARLAAAYDARGSGDARTEGFLQYIERTKIDDPEPSSIRVMTVYQSKGLEFDVVLLPELHDRMLGGGPPALLVADYEGDRSAPPCRIARNRSEAIMSFSPVLASMYLEDRDDKVTERLCVAYVALTRARFETVVLLPVAGETKNASLSVGAVLSETLGLSEVGQCKEFGDTSWIDLVTKVDNAANSRRALITPGAGIVFKDSPKDSQRGFHRERPSIDIGAVDLVGSNEKEWSRNLGRLQHALCEWIEWCDDPSALSMDEAVERLSREPSLRDITGVEIRESAAQQFCASMRGPLSNVFRRARLTSEGKNILSVYRELPFALMFEGALLSGVVDRVVLFKDNVGRRCAEVIDFKLSLNEGGARERYEGQVGKYRYAIRTLFGLDEGAVECVLVDLSQGQMVKM